MFVLLLLFAAIGLLYYYLTKNFDFWEKRNVIGPRPKLLVGNFPSIYNRKKTMTDEIDAIYKTYKGKVPIVGIFRGISPDLLVLDPEIVKQVLITNFSHFVNQHSFVSVTKESDPIVGRNPFFLNDEEWKQTRAEVLPAFSTGRIKALWPIMQAVYQRMAKFIDEQMQAEGSLDHRETCAKYTTDVVATAIYGVESEAFTNPNSEIRTLARNVLSPSFRMTILLSLGPIFPSLTEILKVRFMPEKEANFMTQLWRETYNYRIKNKVDRQDYVDYLIHLKEKKGLSELDLIAHTASFFFDGIETSSITLSNVLYELAKHQTVQDKLRRELATIRTPNGFEYESVMELKYLEQIVYETLRLHPVLGQHARSCTADLEIKLSDDQRLLIPKGMAVWIPIKGLHRDPDYYDEPERFNPDRFSDENGGLKKYRDRCLLLPFGDGPRICLGQRFALAQIKSCLANLIFNYEVLVDPKTPNILHYNPNELMLAYQERVYLNFRSIKI